MGLAASSLAYGRVAQILKSVARLLEVMGSSPCDFLLNISEDRLRYLLSNFKYRFTTGDELAEMLLGAIQVVRRCGSLRECFAAGLKDEHETTLPALCAFVEELAPRGDEKKHNALLPSPRRGSACKRLNLFLRWMVRKDDVDPGGWDEVPTSKLIVPLDTHMHRIGLALGFTVRKCADMRCALEITDALKRFAPEDPVRYDFSLTRLGIRADTDLESFLSELGQWEVDDCA